MSTTAVTEETPAVSTEPNSQFLPTDKNYRLTGEMPADTQEAPAASPEKKETEKSADTEGAPAASAQAADTAAASAAAETQERKGPAQTKTARSSESRQAKLSRENRELRELVARLEGRAEASPSAQREIQQGSQPATEVKGKGRAEPKIDEVDSKTGKPKYATYQDFQNDLRAWDREEALRQFNETSARTQREQQMQQAERTLAEGFTKKLEPARKAHADFDTVALNEDLIIPRGSVTDGFLLDSEHSGEVLYYLGQHPEILEGFYRDYDPKTGRYVNKITPFAQARELTKIELQLSGKSQSSPARTITQAGRPPNQVSGKGTVSPDAVEQAVKDQDQETYTREANARELARLKRK
jgi:hypothetical protein